MLLCMMLLAGGSAMAQRTPIEQDGVIYSVYTDNGNNKAGVDGVSSSFTGTTLTIPQTVTYNGTAYTVDEIGAHVFENNKKIKTVNLSGSQITKIGDSAFYGSVITGISFPSTLTTIGTMAFANCASLSSVNLKSTSITDIPYQCFAGCTALERFVLPSGVKTIGDEVFKNCTSLREGEWGGIFIIPQTLTSIGSAVFAHCDKLAFVLSNKSSAPTANSNVADDSNITLMVYNTSTYQDATGWKNFAYIETFTCRTTSRAFAYEGMEFNVPNADNTVTIGFNVSGYTYPENLVLPSPFEYNGRTYSIVSTANFGGSEVNGVFRGHTEIESVTLPPTFRTFGGNALLDCSNLKKVIILYESGAPNVGEDALTGISPAAVFYVPESQKSRYTDTFWSDKTVKGCFVVDGLIYSTLLDGNDAVLIGATYDALHTDEITIPETVTYNGTAYTVTEIDKNALQGSTCTTVNLPKTINNIGAKAFADCTNLATVNIAAMQSGYIHPSAFNDNEIKFYVPLTTKDYYNSFNLANGTNTVVEADLIINEENFPDANFRNYLLTQTYGRDEKITHDEIYGSDNRDPIILINVSSKEIASLKGIEYFVKLQKLNCRNNQITELDLSRNTELTELLAYNNQLEALDLRALGNLAYVYIQNNQISSLTLPTNLVDLICYNNQLTSLLLASFNSLETLYCQNNQLETLRFPSGTNNQLQTVNCSNNQLTSISITQGVSLKELNCNNNYISSLSIRNADNMETLSCSHNKLKYLLNIPTSLKNLYCDHNGIWIGYLNLSNMTQLENFSGEQAFVETLTLLAGNKLGLSGYRDNVKEKIMSATFDGEAVRELEYSDNYLIVGAISGSTVTCPESITLITDPGKEGFTMPITLVMTDVPTAEISYTTPSSGVGTYSSSYPLDFTNSNLKAYIASGFGENSVLLTRVYKVPANTGIVVKGGKSTAYQIPVNYCNMQYANMLVPVVRTVNVQPTVGDKTNLSLSSGKFLTFTIPSNIGPNRAYLQVPTSTLQTITSSAKEYLTLQFDDEDSEATGIQSISKDAEEGAWYTIHGVKLPAMPTAKGIYIHNGKKVVIP